MLYKIILKTKLYVKNQIKKVAFTSGMWSVMPWDATFIPFRPEHQFQKISFSKQSFLFQNERNGINLFQPFKTRLTHPIITLITLVTIICFSYTEKYISTWNTLKTKSCKYRNTILPWSKMNTAFLPSRQTNTPTGELQRSELKASIRERYDVLREICLNKT